MPVRTHSNGTRDWKGTGVESSLRLSATQYAAVHDLYRRERRNAETIQNIVVSTQNQVGGDFAGWEFRMKTEDSLCRKVAGELRNGVPLNQILGNIKDIHRFTIVESQQYYSDTVERYKDSFRDQNLTQIKDNNTWAVLTYKGINTVQEGNLSGSQTSGHSAQSTGSNGSRAAKASLDAIAESSGAEFSFVDENNRRYRFEVQFHTPASLAVKEAIHPIYEAQRALTNDPGRRIHNALNHMLYRTYEVNRITMPARIEEIGNFAAPGSRPATPQSADWRRAEQLVSQQLGRDYRLERVARSEVYSNSSMDAMASSFANTMSLSSGSGRDSAGSFETGVPSVAGLAYDVAMLYPPSSASQSQFYGGGAQNPQQQYGYNPQQRNNYGNNGANAPQGPARGSGR